MRLGSPGAPEALVELSKVNQMEWSSPQIGGVRFVRFLELKDEEAYFLIVPLT
jgi:hypothetical protein